MDLKNLKTFLTITRESSFSKAAADLGYAQSTVSMQIKQLEAELGVPLFDRCKKNISLSVYGKDLIPYAQELLKYEALARESFQSAEPSGLLNIGIMESLCSSPYIQNFQTFLQLYPKISIRLKVCTTHQAADDLEHGRLDAIFLLDHPAEREDWIIDHSLPEKICFFCASDHPFAKKKEVPLEELLEEPFLFIEKGCNYRQAFEQALSLQGLSAQCRMEIGHTHFLIDSVIQKLGISLLPYSTLLPDLQAEKITLIRVPDFELSMYIQVIHTKSRFVSPALGCLLKESVSWTQDNSASSIIF